MAENNDPELGKKADMKKFSRMAEQLLSSCKAKQEDAR